MFGETYNAGLDILGAVAIPTVGANYTDKATVTAVQNALNNKGFGTLKLDGIMGPKTAAAIRAMQSAAGIPQTGVIDEGVIMALGVTPGVLPPGVTALQAAEVEADSAIDDAHAAAEAASNAADDADAASTQQEIAAAADKVVAAVPPSAPPALRAAAKAAKSAASSAITPQQQAAAKQQVQAVAQQVKEVTAVPTPWWEWAIIGVGGLAVLGGGAALIFGGRRKR